MMLYKLIYALCMTMYNLQVLKLPFRSQLINFIKRKIVRNKNTYIRINAHYEGICVEIERKYIALVFLHACNY